MNSAELWLVKKIIAAEVVQGYGHEKNIKNLYSLIRAACEKEFNEDNSATLKSFLRKLFEDDLKLVHTT